MPFRFSPTHSPIALLSSLSREKVGPSNSSNHFPCIDFLFFSFIKDNKHNRERNIYGTEKKKEKQRNTCLGWSRESGEESNDKVSVERSRDDNGERMKKGRESFESLFKWPVSSESFGRCYMWWSTSISHRMDIYCRK